MTGVATIAGALEVLYLIFDTYRNATKHQKDISELGKRLEEKLDKQELRLRIDMSRIVADIKDLSNKLEAHTSVVQSSYQAQAVYHQLYSAAFAGIVVWLIANKPRNREEA